MTPAAVKTSTPEQSIEETLAAADLAAAALDALRADRAGAPGRFRDAVLAGDADRAVAEQRRADELPVRVLVAEASALRARLAHLAARSAAAEVERDRRGDAMSEARAVLERLDRDRAPRLERDQARLVAENAERQWRPAYQAVRDLRAETVQLRQELDALVAPGRSASAPVVRSQWQASDPRKAS